MTPPSVSVPTPPRAAAAPADPALPRLAEVLDGGAMAAPFAEMLAPQGTRVVGCAVERVKYRPGRNCTVLYRLQVQRGAAAPFSQLVAARLCEPADAARRAERAAARRWVDSPAGPRCLPLPALDLVTWWWPNDARLPAPALLADDARLRRQLLPQVLGALAARQVHTALPAGAYAIEVAQYVPEQRLTVAVDIRRPGDDSAPTRLYAKSSREPGPQAAHTLLARLAASPAARHGRLRLPRALLWQPDSGLHWQTALPGQAWADTPPASTRALAPALGAQLAALHGTPMNLARRITPELLRARLDEAGALLAAALPGSAAVLRAAHPALADGLRHVTASPAATLHGDLHGRNVLVHDGQPGLIDLDGLRHGPALLELGAWVADLQYRAVLEGRAAGAEDAAAQALLDGYMRAGGARFSAGALAWSVAWNLLTQRAWRCVVNLKPGRLAIAPRLLELAASLATGTERQAA